MFGFYLPPPVYDVPFVGTLHRVEVDYWDVPARCGKACDVGPGRRVNAFSRVYFVNDPDGTVRKVCFVVLPKVGTGGITEADQELLERHELGHCNGWPGDHPDGRIA